MKKILYILTLALVVSSPATLYAQSKTPTPTDKAAKTSVTPSAPSVSPTPVDKEVQELKEKIANKVSEDQKKKNQKATAGVVSKVEAKSLTLVAEGNTSYEVKFDDVITKYYRIEGTKKTELKKTDIKKDDYIIVTGPESDKVITANSIFVDEQYVVGSGKIIEVNKDDFTLKVKTQEKETYVLDIESKTQQLLMDIKTLEATKIGFSKIKEGDEIHFVVKKNAEDSKDLRFVAEKILIIPQEYFQK